MNKTIVKNVTMGGERPFFASRNTRFENVVITEGESGVKCCKDIEVIGCKFYGKYPLWHVDGSLVEDSYFAPGSRSAIWYSDNMTMRRCTIDGPKFFREMQGLSLEDVTINDADETFWRVRGLRIRNVELHGGTYPFMFSSDIYVDGLKSDAKYVFQYCRNVEVHDADILTKDSFWECDNVVVYDSKLDGEYLGWHSKNLKFVRCQIAGEQPLCYMDGVTLEDCTFDPACDRAFEDSSRIDARIKGAITNIKNPISGRIVAGTIGSVTLDENLKAPGNCVISGEGLNQ